MAIVCGRAHPLLPLLIGEAAPIGVAAVGRPVVGPGDAGRLCQPRSSFDAGHAVLVGLLSILCGPLLKDAPLRAGLSHGLLPRLLRGLSGQLDSTWLVHCEAFAAVMGLQGRKADVSWKRTRFERQVQQSCRLAVSKDHRTDALYQRTSLSSTMSLSS